MQYISNSIQTNRFKYTLSFCFVLLFCYLYEVPVTETFVTKLMSLSQIYTYGCNEEFGGGGGGGGVKVSN